MNYTVCGPSERKEGRYQNNYHERNQIKQKNWGNWIINKFIGLKHFENKRQNNPCSKMPLQKIDHPINLWILSPYFVLATNLPIQFKIRIHKITGIGSGTGSSTEVVRFLMATIPLTKIKAGHQIDQPTTKLFLEKMLTNLVSSDVGHSFLGLASIILEAGCPNWQLPSYFRRTSLLHSLQKPSFTFSTANPH